MKGTRSWLTWGSTVLVLAVACGGGSENGPSQFGFPTTGSGGTSPTGGPATGTATGTGAGSGGVRSTGAGAGLEEITSVVAPPESEVCAKDQALADVSPLDIYILQDRSLSMDDKTSSGETKWSVITKALQSFLSDPASAGLQVGIGFYPQFISEPAPGTTGTPDPTCDFNRYAVPSVPIAPIPDNAAAIINAYANLYPLGETPTRVAEMGATDYAKAFAKSNPKHRVVVVLATDGNPNVCQSTVQSVVIAADGARRTTPSIRTYVIGVMAADQPDKITNLNMMAVGGGTGAAFVVDPFSGTGEQFVRAMTAIRNSNKMVCQFDIPRAASGDIVDVKRAAMTYAAAGGAPTPLTWRQGFSQCGDSEGYFFDNNFAPSSIKLCPTTCNQVQTDAAAKLEWVFACKPQIIVGSAGGTTEVGTTPPPPAEAGGTVEQPQGQGGHGGEPDTTATCLLTGMSCTESTECCNGSCWNGICQVPIM